MSENENENVGEHRTHCPLPPPVPTVALPLLSPSPQNKLWDDCCHSRVTITVSVAIVTACEVMLETVLDNSNGDGSSGSSSNGNKDDGGACTRNK